MKWYLGLLVLAVFLVACTHANQTQTSATENTEVELDQEISDLDGMVEELDDSELQDLEGELDNL